MNPAGSESIDPFAGEGELRSLYRGIDWARAPMGPVERWPLVLRSTIRTVLESPFAMSVWCEPDLTLIYNDGYRSVLGAKHPSAAGRPGPEVWSEIWHRLEPIFSGIRAGGAPMYVEDVPYTVERGTSPRPRKPAGDPNAWFTAAVSPIRDPSDEIVAHLAVVFETTERVIESRAREILLARAESAESLLRGIFDQAPAFMAMMRGPDQVIEFANAAFYKLVGHRDLIGRPAGDALPELREHDLARRAERAIRTGEPFVGREVPVRLARAPDGEAEERFIDFVYFPVTEPGGGRSRVVVHGADVTDYVKAREDAQRARAEAEEANRTKSQFLATMSHEIRTPINAIVGYAELLEMGIEGPLTDGQRSQIDRIRESSRHLQGLIEDILDLAKVEAGRLSVEQERVLVSGTVSAALALIRPQASDRGIEILDDCTGDQSTFYVGDEDRVRQILVNLLSNAVRFTEPGGRVRVACGAFEDGERRNRSADTPPMMYISVNDTGVGIAAEELERIFLPFTQLERGHTRTQGGSGLGLTISRHLARLMGGDLLAESEPGKGSTFTLTLPMEPGAVDALLQSGFTPGTEERPPNLDVVGRSIRESIPELLDRFGERLRQDPGLPAAGRLDDANLLDHVSALVADIAATLTTLEHARAPADTLLHDGSEIQRVISDLHGRQRAGLGWTADAIDREYDILVEEIESATRARVPDTVEIDGALHVARRLVERGKRVSRRSLMYAAGRNGAAARSDGG